jgi:hypothetical protein
MPKTIKPVVDIPALLDATADLESGHSIEAVLAQHGLQPPCIKRCGSMPARN